MVWCIDIENFSLGETARKRLILNKPSSDEYLKSQSIVEYALRDVNKPIGVSTYQLRDALPEKLQGNLPTIEQLEAELKAVSVEIDNICVGGKL